MIAPVILPLVRRAILDLLADIGGEHNDDVLSIHLNTLGHSVARRDVREQLHWLAGQELLVAEQLGPFTVARITADGRDLSAGRLTIEGVGKFRTGE